MEIGDIFLAMQMMKEMPSAEHDFFSFLFSPHNVTFSAGAEVERHVWRRLCSLCIRRKGFFQYQFS